MRHRLRQVRERLLDQVQLLWVHGKITGRLYEEAISYRHNQAIYAHPQSRYVAPGQIGRASPALQKRELDGKKVVFAETL